MSETDKIQTGTPAAKIVGKPFYEGLYKIEGFGRYVPGERSQNFSIFLRGDVWNDLVHMTRPDGLGPLLLETLERLVSEADRRLCRVEFYETSMLLRSLHIGSDCACFFLEPAYLGSKDLTNSKVAFQYSGHNLDTQRQAAAALATWLAWFNIVCDLAGYKQPFCI